MEREQVDRLNVATGEDDPPLEDDAATDHAGPTDSDLTREIGRRLRDVRHGQGLTLAALSERTAGAMSKSRISNYEQGIRRLGLEEAMILAEALGVVSPAWLLCLDDADAPLSDTEQHLMRLYRAADARGRRLIQTVAQLVANEVDRPTDGC